LERTLSLLCLKLQVNRTYFYKQQVIAHLSLHHNLLSAFLT